MHDDGHVGVVVLTEQEDAAELAVMRAEIAEVRRARMNAERAASAQHSVELALAAAEQDRDAVSSPALEEVRRRAARLSVRLETAWRETDWLRVMVSRVSAAGFDLQHDRGLPGGTEIYRVLAEEESARLQAKTALTDAGVVSLRVPAPAPLHIRDHPNREKIAAALDEGTQELAAREARSRSFTRRRRPDEPGAIRGPR